jgi:hypothetical protein
MPFSASKAPLSRKKLLSTLIAPTTVVLMVLVLSTACHGFVPRLARTPPSPTTLLQAKKSKTTVAREGTFWKARTDCWRPTVNDVERISFGKPAKQKGTGSRGVPHRLNEEERFLFDQARSKGFLEVAGSGWRSQRREAPLLNSYRSICDAKACASIVLHKGNTGIDELVVDVSPLRYPDTFHDIAQECLEHQPGGEVIFQKEGEYEEDQDEFDEAEAGIISSDDTDTDGEPSVWETRPIYQLPPYCIAWEIPRADAKALGKKMAELFDSAEGKRASSKKPIGVKAGKGRRHGGYGIG